MRPRFVLSQLHGSYWSCSVAVAFGLFIASFALISLGVQGRSSAVGQAPARPLPNINPGTPKDPCLAGRMPISARVETKPAQPSGDPGRPTQPQARPFDEVTFEWPSLPILEDITCIMVFRGREGDPDASSFAEFQLPADARTLVVEPAGGSEPGEVCYRFVPVSGAGYGDATEVCVQIRYFRGGSPPAVDEPAPPSAGQGLGSGSTPGVFVAGFAAVVGTTILMLAVNTRRRRRAE